MKDYNKYIKLWNAGYCKYVQHYGDDNTPLKAARMSTLNETGVDLVKDNNLRDFLWRKGHVSVYEQAGISIEIQVPIFIARQFMRHKSLCLSGDTELYFDLPNAISSNKRAIYKKTINDVYKAWKNSSYTSKRLSAMKLRMCNEETGLIEHTNIVDIWHSGIKDVFEIELKNGYKIKTTKEHKFFTKDGWKTLEEYTGVKTSKNLNAVWNCGEYYFAVNGIPVWQDLDWLTEKRKLGLSVSEIANEAGCSYHTIKKWLKTHNLTFTASEKGVLSGKSQTGIKRQRCKKKTYTEDGLAKLKAARSGKNSNFWKGGVSSDREKIGRWTTDQAKRVHEKYNFKCVICAGKDNLHAHHLDPIWNNIDLAQSFDNLISLCQKCHSKIHNKNLELVLLNYVHNKKELKDFFYENNVRLKIKDKCDFKNKKLIKTYSELKSIKYVGKEDVYDITVSGPYHNFIANGFVVHNCVNEFSQRYSEPMFEYYIPDNDDVCYDNEFNKQMSGMPVDNEISNEYINFLKNESEESKEKYEKWRALGISKERVRDSQPVNSFTRIMATANLRDWFFFLSKRLKPDAQKEIRELSESIYLILKDLFPLCCKTFEENTLYAETVSKTELVILKEYMHVLPNLTGLVSKEEMFDSICAKNNLNKSRTRELKQKLKMEF